MGVYLDRIGRLDVGEIYLEEIDVRPELRKLIVSASLLDDPIPVVIVQSVDGPAAIDQVHVGRFIDSDERADEQCLPRRLGER